MANELKLTLTLNIADFKKQLQEAISASGKINDIDIEISADASEAESAAEDATGAVEGIPDAEAEITADSSEAEGAAEDAAGAIESIPDEKETVITADGSGALQTISQLSMAYQGLVVLFAKVKEKIKGVISPFQDFEQVMANVEAISGATSEQMELLEADAKRLGSTTKFTATQVGELQTEFSKLGFTSDELLKVTAGTLDLAAATGEDLAESATVAGATLRGFRLEADETNRVTDVMAKSFSSSALDLFKFKESMKTVAPISAAAGFSIEETTALLGKLADAGLHGSIAGMGLKNILMQLSDESSGLNELFGGQVKTYDDLVVKLKELKAGNFDLADATKYLDKRSAATFLTLINSADDVDVLKKSLDNAAGSAKEMAEIQMDTLEGATLRLGSANEALAIRFTEFLAPALKSIKDFFAGLITTIVNGKDVFEGLAVTLGVAGIALIALNAKLILSKLAVLGLNAAMLLNPVTFIITAIIALGVAITALASKVGGFKNLWGLFQKGAVASFKIVWEYLKAFGTGIFEFGKSAVKLLTAPYTIMFKVVKEVFANISGLMKDLFSGNFKGIAERLKTGFSDAFKSVSESITNSFENGIDAFAGLGGKAKEIWAEVGIVAVESSEKAKEIIEETEPVIPEISAIPRPEDLKVRPLKLSEAGDIDALDERMLAIEEAFQRQKELEGEYSEFYKSNILDRRERFEIEQQNKLDKLREFHEQGIIDEETYNDHVQKTNSATTRMQISAAKSYFGDVASLMDAYKGKSKTLFEIGKAAAISQAVINTYQGITKALASYPFPFSLIPALAAGAMGFQQVAKIKAEKYSLGGTVAGRSHAEGGTIIEAEDEEEIIRKSRAAEFRPLLKFINDGPISSVRDWISNFKVPRLNIPAVPQFAYASGGSVVSSGSDLGAVVERMEQLEDAVCNMRLTGELELLDGRSGTNIYKAHLEAKAEHERQIK